MGTIYPSIEKINQLKVKPEPSELFLLDYLSNNTSDSVEIYFQPYLNGDNPDIIMLEKDVGVTIIEVKEWNLDSYYLDDKSEWRLSHNDVRIRSPFKQVFQYKDNMFNLHINGLLEKKILDTRFYGRINCFVYFHNINANDLKRFYQPLISDIEEKIREKRDKRKDVSGLANIHSKILKQRDFYSKTIDSIKNIKLPNKVNNLFPESIYKEFKRHLNPPYHTLEQGKEISYTKKQLELSVSVNKHQKIKGVAGCGKTLILAKRAVNAHKRHGDDVLILTFNISLRSYIKDMISNVRENFSWDNFTILHYHLFFSVIANQLNLEIDSLDDYDNEDFFINSKTKKYKTILIDEIQDYKEEWIRLIKKSFLEEDGELVVFGDEKQNLYNRSLGEDKKPNTTIVGGWNILNESFRLDSEIAKLAEKFQSDFFINKYETDNIESNRSTQSTMNFDVNIIEQKLVDLNNIENIVDALMSIIKERNIHPNDICILSYHIRILRDIDFIIRTKYNEKTITTFESLEVFKQLILNQKNKQILESDIKDIRKIKKNSFRLNNGMMKISTIQSFKGWETPTLFLIIDNDFDESIYTAITRSRHNIIVLNIETNKYYQFFEKNKKI